MTPARDAQINYINIGLMVISMIAAYVLPFEVFLFAYAFLGPLHYLTEISWLHDRQYFAKGKYDYIPLLIIGIVLSYAALANDFDFHRDFLNQYHEINLGDILLCLALFSSILFAFVKNLFVKLLAILLLFIFIYKYFNGGTNTDNFAVFAVTSLVPTLIHVYLFTGLFMLYGALKSRSKSGLISVVVFAIIPFILMRFLPAGHVVPVTNYGKAAYYANGDGFFNTNSVILREFGFGTATEPKMKNYTVVNIIDKFSEETKVNPKSSQIKTYKDSLNKKAKEDFFFSSSQSAEYKKGLEFKEFYKLVENDPIVNAAVSGANLDNKVANEKLNEVYRNDVVAASYDAKAPFIFYSSVGILLMRFIAFAYLYHYLNWFSKTEVIRWHKVPKARFILVIGLWLLACGLYIYDYGIGLTFLFFLSFTHVLLEFPLNMVSIFGIGKEAFDIFKNGFSSKKDAPVKK
jgi:hypothetical protein